jgi:hypothetical protein
MPTLKRGGVDVSGVEIPVLAVLVVAVVVVLLLSAVELVIPPLALASALARPNAAAKGGWYGPAIICLLSASPIMYGR